MSKNPFRGWTIKKHKHVKLCCWGVGFFHPPLRSRRAWGTDTNRPVSNYFMWNTWNSGGNLPHFEFKNKTYAEKNWFSESIMLVDQPWIYVTMWSMSTLIPCRRLVFKFCGQGKACAKVLSFPIPSFLISTCSNKHDFCWWRHEPCIQIAVVAHRRHNWETSKKDIGNFVLTFVVFLAGGETRGWHQH